MNKDEYKKLVDSLTPKPDKLKNSLIAFVVGGFMGLLTEALVIVVMYFLGVARVDAYLWVCLIVIFLASLFTALGFFDNWVSKSKMGLILPTTGFAHSITSSAMDYKKDGFVTGIGANVFKLAGSVILYGIVFAFIFGVIGGLING